MRNEQRLGARTINRAAEQLATRFNPERIALAIASALHSSELSALRETLNQARYHIADVLPTLHLNRMPTRNELMAQAQAMFARTRHWTKSSTSTPATSPICRLAVDCIASARSQFV